MKAEKMSKRDYLSALVYVHQLQSLLMGRYGEAYRDSRMIEKINAKCGECDYKDDIMWYAFCCSCNEEDLLDGGEDDPDLSLIGNCLVTLGNIIG